MATTADDPVTQEPAQPAPPIDLPVEHVTSGRSDRVDETESPRQITPRRTPSRRTKVSLRSVGALSVLKVSMLFWACAMLGLWLALLMIYLVMEAGGVTDTIYDWAGCIVNGAQGTKDECIPVVVNTGQLFTWLFVGVAGLAVVLSAITTFVAIMYNLISDLVGGVDVTLADRTRG